MPCRLRSRATCSTSGDWVTARLDGVVYLEKAPLIYWADRDLLQDLSESTTGPREFPSHCQPSRWLADCRVWNMGLRQARRLLRRPVHVRTCVGLFLFTRILIPDVMLTLTIALAMWAFLRALDEEEPRPALVGISTGRQSWHRTAAEEPDRRGLPGCRRNHLSGHHRAALPAGTWKRLHPFSGIL